VFTVVNIAVLVLRKDTVDHKHFRAPTVLPIIGAISCAFLATPLTDRDPAQYKIAGVLLAIGVVLWFVNNLANKKLGVKAELHPEYLGEEGVPPGPTN
jgi:hypothetical protein